MKLNRNPKCNTYALYALGVICASIAFYFIVLNFSDITKGLGTIMGLVSPFIIGFAFAYLLIRPLRFVENLLQKYLFRGKGKPTLKRTISIVIVLLLTGVFLSVISYIVVPQLLESLNTLTSSLPGYARTLQGWANSLIANSNLSGTLLETVAPYWQQILNYLSNFLSQLAPWILNFSMSLASRVMNVVVSFIVSIYFLYSKELFAMQLKKLLYSFLPVRFMDSLVSTAHIVDDTFGGYINGQLLDALIVGTITTLSMVVLQLPYALLIGVIVACTNIIPMVGPFIGAVPSTFIILMAGKPLQAVTFLIMILVIQQIDGNILVPKIVGDSTGISGFWVLFAIIVAGGLFGIGGIVLCVPTLSVLFKLLKVQVEHSLARRNLPISSASYGKDAVIPPKPLPEEPPS